MTQFGRPQPCNPFLDLGRDDQIEPACGHLHVDTCMWTPVYLCCTLLQVRGGQSTGNNHSSLPLLGHPTNKKVIFHKCTHKWLASMSSRLKSIQKQPTTFMQYPILLTLYVQYTNKSAIKKWLPFEPICAVYFNITYQPPTLSTLPNFTDLLCSVWQETSCQKVASIWAHMCRIHSNLEQLPCSNLVRMINWPYMFCLPSTHLSKSGFNLSLYVQYT